MSVSVYEYTHTHTHIYIYIYIYIVCYVYEYILNLNFVLRLFNHCELFNARSFYWLCRLSMCLGLGSVFLYVLFYCVRC